MLHVETSPFTERVAAELRAELSRQRRTASQMSTELHIPRSTLGKRLVGNGALDTDQLAAITRWLGVTIEEIVRRAEAKVPA